MCRSDPSSSRDFHHKAHPTDKSKLDPWASPSCISQPCYCFHSQCCPSASFCSNCPACCFDTWDPNASMYPFHAHPMPLWLVLAPWQKLVHAPPPPATASGMHCPHSLILICWHWLVGTGWRAPVFPLPALHSLASPSCFWLWHMGP